MEEELKTTEIKFPAILALSVRFQKLRKRLDYTPYWCELVELREFQRHCQLHEDSGFFLRYFGE